MEELYEDQDDALIAEEIWEEISKAGFDVPIEAPVSGISMRPLLRRKGDYVRIIPLRREVLLGDIIVFRRRRDGRLIMHRVFEITPEYIQTIGDNCDHPDGKITYSDVYGLVTHMRRGKHSVYIDNDIWRAIGRFMTKTIPVRRFMVHRVRRPLVKIAKKILRR